jgi:hypothetical protein
VSRREYEFSKHAVDQSIIRDISVAEVEQAILDRGALVIEDYPEDKYGPSCLVLGFTKAGRPLHVQCRYPARPLLKIITWCLVLVSRFLVLLPSLVSRQGLSIPGVLEG